LSNVCRACPPVAILLKDIFTIPFAVNGSTAVTSYQWLCFNNQSFYFPLNTVIVLAEGKGQVFTVVEPNIFKLSIPRGSTKNYTF
jgi:hypothetical protein